MGWLASPPIHPGLAWARRTNSTNNTAGPLEQHFHSRGPSGSIDFLVPILFAPGVQVDLRWLLAERAETHRLADVGDYPSR